MEFVLFMGLCVIFFFFPVLMGIGYIIYLVCSYLNEPCPIHNKLTKKDQQLKQEKQKNYFYNWGLPSIIYMLIYIIIGLKGLSVCAILGVFFWIFYLIYQFFYALGSQCFGYKYYNSKMEHIIFWLGFVLGILGIPLAILAQLSV